MGIRMNLGRIRGFALELNLFVDRVSFLLLYATLLNVITNCFLMSWRNFGFGWGSG